jgi:hypothetical protein
MYIIFVFFETGKYNFEIEYFWKYFTSRICYFQIINLKCKQIQVTIYDGRKTLRKIFSSYLYLVISWLYIN